MNILYKIAFPILKFGFKTVCHIEAQGAQKLPMRGPLILYANHTGQIEAPVLVTLLEGRPISGWAKAEAFENPVLRWLFNNWGIIPVRRGEADTSALRVAIQKLNDGVIFGIAPEGTRSKTGQLLRGQPGAVMLALHSGAPLQPVAHWGGEKFKTNIRKFRRTHISVRVGRPFKLDAKGEKMTREVRQQMVDEMMYTLSALLPAEYRGEYGDLSKATTKYLNFGVGAVGAVSD